MKLQKKHFIAIGIGAFSVTAALLYMQYKKLMDYCMSFNKFVLKKISFDQIDLDLFLNFKNNSSIKLNITSQEYEVFLNERSIAVINNTNPVIIEPKKTSVLPLNIKFSPSSVAKYIGNIATDIAFKPEKVILKVKCKIKVKFWMFNISIPYEYITSLKDLKENKQQNSSTTNEKKC